jgi:hypothetical protein
LEQIAGLSMARYGEAPAFRSSGKVVAGHVTAEMHAMQEQKMKVEEEKAKAAQDAEAKRKADAAAAQARLKQKEERLLEEVALAKRQLVEKEVAMKEEHEMMLAQKEKAHEVALAQTQKLAEIEGEKKDALHNENALVAFYTKHNPARVADIPKMLKQFSLESLTDLSQTRYGEAPDFRSGGKRLMLEPGEAVTVDGAPSLEHTTPATSAKQGTTVAIDVVDGSRAVPAARPAAAKLTPEATAAKQEDVVAKMMAQVLASKEAPLNEAALRTFYQQHNPDRVADVKVVLQHYSLVHIVALSKLRYGSAPLFVSNGAPVSGGEVTAEMKTQQESKRLQEQQGGKKAQDEQQEQTDAATERAMERVRSQVARARASVRGKERAAEGAPAGAMVHGAKRGIAAQRLEAQQQADAARRVKAKAEETRLAAQRMATKQEAEGVFSDDGGVFSDDYDQEEDGEEEALEQKEEAGGGGGGQDAGVTDAKERYCNKMELAQFYRKHNQPMLKQVAALLDAVSLEQIAGHAQKRYG